MIKKSVFLMCVLLVGFCSLSFLTKTEKKIYDFKKGEVLDILFLSLNADRQENLANYFKTATPVAKQEGYQGLRGFKVKTPLQGNYHPNSMILGRWADVGGRKKFLKKIDDVMPNFHSERRNIWSSFMLTYYEMKEDLHFEVDPSKYNVVTAYWGNDIVVAKKFSNAFERGVTQSGGSIILNLQDGASPYGYYYNPSFMVLSEWESQEAFERYQTANKLKVPKSIYHVNEFPIQ